MRLLLCLLLIGFIPAKNFASSPEKRILYVTINEAGRVMVGADMIDINDVPTELKNRLFKSSLGNRKYSKISISKSGENVSLTSFDQLKTKVQEGQQMALNAICLEKFKTLFAELDDKKKEKLRKQFPVLFQMEYSWLHEKNL